MDRKDEGKSLRTVKQRERKREQGRLESDGMASREGESLRPWHS